MRNIIYRILKLFHPLIHILYRNRLRVLAYHTVPDKKAFELQLNYLSKHYNLISVEDLQLYLEKRKSLPAYPLLITFDDGDVSVFEKGLPVLKKFNAPSCLFIITKLINSNNEVWIKKVEEGEKVKGKTYQEARAVVKHMKSIPNNERLLKMEKYSDLTTDQLNTGMLKEMLKSGMYIGNHSHTHPMFDKCTEEELKLELDRSKQIFNSLGLEGFSVFAYPNGNEDTLSEQVLIKEGVRMIFLFDHKINPKNINPHRISRIKVDSDTKLTEFKAKVSGVHPLILQLKNKILA